MGVSASVEVENPIRASAATTETRDASKCLPKSPTADPGGSVKDAIVVGAELIQLRQNAPLRPPDWRARLASVMARHPDRRVVEKLTTWADDAVRELVRLDREPLAFGNPLTEARALFRPEQRLLRIEVEARLLAGQSTAAIDDVSGLQSGTAARYRSLYYDCSDRLHAAGVIRHMFLCGVPQADCGSGPSLEWCKWYGYYGGVAVLETLLDTFRHWEVDRRPSRGGTADELARRARRLYARASVLARSITVENLGRAEYRALFALAADRGEKSAPRQPREAEHPGRRYTTSSGSATWR